MDTTTKEQERGWRQLLSGLSKNYDVTRMLIPADFLRPKSTLECLAAHMQHGRLLEAIPKGETDMDRLIAVTKFHVSGLIKEVFDGKKPYNPVLGETSAWVFDHSDPAAGKTKMLCEQVSHHPPISALFINNDTLGISEQGSMQTGARFNGNSITVPFGDRKLVIHDRGEEYLMTMPTMQFRGLFFGSRGAEWIGKVVVWCKKTELVCEMDFHPLGFLGMWGEWHRVTGLIRHHKKGNEEEVASIEGHWDRQLVLTDKVTGETKVLYDFDEAAASKATPRIPPTKEPLPSDSTVVWSKVTAALLEDDIRTANVEKQLVEQAQRDLRVKEKEIGEEFFPRFFELRQGTWEVTEAARKFQREEMCQ